MPAKLLPDTSAAAQLRAFVQPGNPQIAAASPLATLTDDQLFRVAGWMKDGKSNELICRQIKDVWGHWGNRTWKAAIDALNKFREFIFSGQEPLALSIELLFDPLAENAQLVRELWTEWEYWSNAARGAPDNKEICDRADKLGRLLADTIQGHANMMTKLGKTADKGDAPEKSTYNVQSMQILIGQLNSPNMPDFLSRMQKEFERIARPVKGKKPAAKPKQLTA